MTDIKTSTQQPLDYRHNFAYLSSVCLCLMCFVSPFLVKYFFEQIVQLCSSASGWILMWSLSRSTIIPVNCSNQNFFTSDKAHPSTYHTPCTFSSSSGSEISLKSSAHLRLAGTRRHRSPRYNQQILFALMVLPKESFLIALCCPSLSHLCVWAEVSRHRRIRL